MHGLAADSRDSRDRIAGAAYRLGGRSEVSDCEGFDLDCFPMNTPSETQMLSRLYPKYAANHTGPERKYVWTRLFSKVHLYAGRW